MPAIRLPSVCCAARPRTTAVIAPPTASVSGCSPATRSANSAAAPMKISRIRKPTVPAAAGSMRLNSAGAVKRPRSRASATDHHHDRGRHAHRRVDAEQLLATPGTRRASIASSGTTMISSRLAWRAFWAVWSVRLRARDVVSGMFGRRRRGISSGQHSFAYPVPGSSHVCVRSSRSESASWGSDAAAPSDRLVGTPAGLQDRVQKSDSCGWGLTSSGCARRRPGRCGLRSAYRRRAPRGAGRGARSSGARPPAGTRRSRRAARSRSTRSGRWSRSHSKNTSFTEPRRNSVWPPMYPRPPQRPQLDDPPHLLSASR